MSTENNSPGNGKTNGRQAGTWPLLLAALLVAVGAVVAILLNNMIQVRRTEAPKPETIPVTVTSFYPEGEVKSTVNITIEFSQNLVTEDRVDELLDEAPVEITPGLPGRFKWIARHRLRFFPDIAFKPATSYTVRIKPGIIQGDNAYLDGEREFSFNTERLKIKDSATRFIYDRGAEIESRVEWRLEFNYDVDAELLAKHVSIFRETGRKVDELDTEISPVTGAHKVFRIVTGKIDRSFQEGKDRRIRFELEEGLTCTAGPLGLAHTFTTAMKVETDLKVYSVYSKSTSEAPFIKIELSSPVEPQLASEHIRVEPETDYRLEADGRFLSLRGAFSAGRSYEVFISSGLLGSDGTRLEEDFSQSVMMEDLEPDVSFTKKGIYLPAKGNRKLAVESVNLDSIRIEIEKVYNNNIVHLLQDYSPYGYWYYNNDLGREVYSRKIEIKSERNQKTTTVVDVGHFWDESERKGLFRVIAMQGDHRWRRDTLLVMLTDLGLMAVKSGDQLFVTVNSLKTLDPVSGVEISLMSSNNQVIDSARTDYRGTASIDNLRNKISGEDFTPYLIVARKGEDVSFLKFSDCRMSLASFDVAGRPYITKGYEAFVYTDRGIYRPGDTANFAAFIRDAGMSPPPAFPVKLEILDPDNRTFDEQVKNPENGFIEFSLDVPDYARTGSYTATLSVGEDEIGRERFNVEDFIPDKIKVTVEPDSSVYETGDEMKVTVTGMSLFGPPAAGRKAEAKLTIQAHRFSPSRWGDYTFGNTGHGFEEMEIELGEGKLDDEGKISFSTKIPENVQPPSMLKGVISTTVTEHGGRAVSAYEDVDIHPYPFYIGLRPVKEGYGEIDREYQFQFVTVDRNGEEIDPGNLKAKVYRVIYHSVLKEDDRGYYRYVSEKQDRLLTEFSVDSSGGRVGYTPTTWGRYRMVLCDPAGYACSSHSFYASGWGYAPWSMENPDRIDLELEKDIYAVGEKARLLVKSPFPGRLIITVEQDSVLDYRVETMDENTATIDIPVKKEYRPNSYISATVIKSLEDYDGHTPVRAFGVVPLSMDNSDRKLSVSIDAPESVKPESRLDLGIKVSGARGRAVLTVAAVDEGILQLIDFQTPDPFGFFYGKRRLGLGHYDIYSFILPEVDRPAGVPAGDYIEKVIKKHLTPVGIRRIKPVSLWSGKVETDSSGRAKVSFDVPRFQGRLRIMAVTADGREFGSGRTDVFVRDPIVVKPTFPRFLASGDRFSVPVSIYNGTGGDASIKVTLETSGLTSVEGDKSKSVLVADGKESMVFFKVDTAQGTGATSFVVKASGNGKTTRVDTDVPVRPSGPPMTKTGSGIAKEGEPFTIELPGNWIEGTQNAKLVLSSFPAVQFSNGLGYLLRYPHGCVEQTTSKVLPLLYFDELARMAEPHLFENNSAGYYVRQGIQKLVSMQQENGGFSYWPGGDHINTWGSVYASHFMVEARKAGYSIPDTVYNRMLEYLKEVVKQDPDENDHYSWYNLQKQVYAAYVLSIAGVPPRSTISYIKDEHLDDLRDSSRLQLAYCFAAAGDSRTAKSLLPTIIHPVEVERQTGGNFNSSTRSNAIMLDVIVELFPENPGIPVLVKELVDSAENGRWYTTQENAFAFLALGKAMKAKAKADYMGTLKVGGEKHAEFDETGATFESPGFAGREVEVSVEGEGECYVYWQAWGVVQGSDFEEYDQGIRVRRKYMDIDGHRVAPEDFRQGKLYVVEISAKALDKTIENVILDDMLPAGLEIENPRLESRADIPWLKKKGDYTYDYMDIRDDRMLLYVNLPARSERNFYYGLRAVTRGSFTLPPVSAECMYDPTYTSVQDSGSIVINEPEP